MVKLLDLLVFLTSAFLLGFRAVWSMDVVIPEKAPVLPPVEWFGDPRGGNPDDEAFYDISYDDYVCPTGLRSSAVRNYAFVGQVITVIKNGNGTDDCLRKCYQIPQCKSVNVYLKRRNACELNASDQFDDPTKLVSVSNAIYYDRIQCPVPQGS